MARLEREDKLSTLTDPSAIGEKGSRTSKETIAFIEKQLWELRESLKVAGSSSLIFLIEMALIEIRDSPERTVPNAR